MHLFFDTETTGLPNNWNAPITDVNNWPRMIQIGWILSDNGNRIDTGNYIIKPENFSIPIEASKIHGITTEKAIAEGVDLAGLLHTFNDLIDRSDCIVAHNIDFDKMILGAELLRKGVPSSFEYKPKLCTMKTTTNYCQIPGNYGYKWPKLTELHTKLFGESFEGAHDAFADIDATERCFWELKRRGVL